jgi:DNA-binding GntR family transcriptional regulator/dienelactone hydrolase
MTEALATASVRLEHASLAERAYQLIRERILKGELWLGTALSRRDLASELGMSLIPVSEALQRLEGEGLVESRPRVGTRVYAPTQQDIRERFVVREALEGQAARLFSEKASPREREDFRKMAARVDELFNRRSCGQGGAEFLYAVQTFHLQFHMRIAECTGCRFLIKLIEQTHVLVFNWLWDATERPRLRSRSHHDLADVPVGTNPKTPGRAPMQNVRLPLSTAKRFLTLCAAASLTFTMAAHSAGDSDPSRSAVTDYCVREATRITEQGRRDTASIEAWEQVSEKRRAELQEMLGLAPWPLRTPLKAVITGKLVKGSYIIEKLAYQSLPGIYVTANLYLPSGGRAPHPAVVYVCGHGFSPYGAKAFYRDYPASLAKYGYVVLAIDPVQISETYALHHGPSGYGMFDWYALGYTAGGAEVWNAMRGIDYLETRFEVDAKRIGMTGRSGGGATSWLTAALDPRVKVIVPGASIITYVSHLRDYTDLRKCDCMFFGNIYRHDMLDLGGLLAPRPVYMIYGKKDPGFPSAYPEFERQIGALYRAYGKPEALRSLGEDAGHEGTQLQRSEMVRFFDRYLMGIP